MCRASTSPTPSSRGSKAPRTRRTKASSICIDLIQEIREIDGVSGVHVMAYRQEEYVSEIVHQSGVLRGRTPWRRDFQPSMQAVETIGAS